MRKKQGHLFVTEMDSAKDGLCIAFDNGQKFLLSVKEIS